MQRLHGTLFVPALVSVALMLAAPGTSAQQARPQGFCDIF